MYTNKSVGTDLYPHMPILCVARTLDESASEGPGHMGMTRTGQRATPTHKPASPPGLARALFYPIFGLWENKVSQNVSFPALDANEPPSKI